MSEEPYSEVPIARHWTVSAVECYELSANCSKCSTARIISFGRYGGCKMPGMVERLLKKFGKPGEKNFAPREGHHQ